MRTLHKDREGCSRYIIRAKQRVTTACMVCFHPGRKRDTHANITSKAQAGGSPQGITLAQARDAAKHPAIHSQQRTTQSKTSPVLRLRNTGRGINKLQMSLQRHEKAAS